MRFIIQRTTGAKLSIDDKVFSSIGPGLVVLVGYSAEDVHHENIDKIPLIHEKFLSRLLGLRIFADEDGKMNNDLSCINGEVLLVSQFTLYADCKKGRRPSFSNSAPSKLAEALYNDLVKLAKDRLQDKLKTGAFGAEMEIDFVNDGPVTLIFDSADF